jgi:hypothetical protein
MGERAITISTARSIWERGLRLSPPPEAYGREGYDYLLHQKHGGEAYNYLDH